MAAPNSKGNEDLFDAYFRKADLDGDGHISGAEAVAFFQGSNLPKNILAQVWAYADSKKAGYLSRAEFYNALKLVTVAQSKRELTPDIVKAALYGAASAKIPAPQINLAATPSPQPRAVTPATQAGGFVSAPSQAAGIRGSRPSGNASTNQQYPPVQQNQLMRPAQNSAHGAPVQPQQNFRSQGMLTGGTMAPRPTYSSTPSNLLSGSAGGSLGQATSQVPSNQNVHSLTTSGLTSSLQPRPQTTAGQIRSTPPKTQDSAMPSTQLMDKDSKELTVSANGVASDSLFGDVFSAAPAQPKQNSLTPTSSISSSSVSTGIAVATDKTQATARQSSVAPTHNVFSQHTVGGQNQHGQSTGKPVQQFSSLSTASSSAGFPIGSGTSASRQVTQAQLPLPKMTSADVQKYTKVFVQVDTDRDGKITGHQARNLFLSWKLPREVLKQVWDLSDQDNDSMLSLREFCIALYLMERYREGCPLPTALPSTILPSENLFSVTGQPAAPHGSSSWGLAHGFHQQQGPGAPRPPQIPRGKPPRPVPVSHDEGAVQPTQQKRKFPVLEKHLVDQLSKEEQESLNSKLEEATAVDKKVEGLEKEIADSKQKIEFCRAKMQELVLYKSRCDNRFNEITERVSADKHEVESLVRKYEEKYKQSGDVASKLTLEEATFRDIQEKKMELYKAIVKFEEGSLEDGVIKARLEQIQSGLEELAKTLNERCKQYGLRGKPTSLVELPFGWQLGIQEGAADWDEDWDKLEDEGFTFVEELTLDVQNVVALSKQKSTANNKEAPLSTNEGSDVLPSKTDAKSEKVPSMGETIAEKESASEKSDARTPESPARNSSAENQSEIESDNVKSGEADGSPRSSDHGRGGVKSTVTGGKSFDQPSWGTFDSHHDTNSVLGFSLDSEKQESNTEKYDGGFGFGFDEFSIKPIKTSFTKMDDDMIPGKTSLFTDSIPNTPADAGNAFPGKKSFFDDSVPSTPANASNVFSGKKSFFDDSILSTPAYAGSIFPEKKSFFDDSVPSTPAYPVNIFPEKKSFFEDSVPSTPAYSLSDVGSKTPFASETPHSDNLFPGRGPFMFDSIPSTPAHKSNEYAFDSFSRFDSFNMHEKSYSLSRDDSVRSSSEPDMFSSRFDSFNSQRFDSFNSQSFDSSDNAHHSGFSQSPRNSLARFDSIHSTKETDSHGFGFDDSDPFGSSGLFKTSAETPRSSDHWNAL